MRRAALLVALLVRAGGALSARRPPLDLSVTARAIARAYDACDAPSCDVAAIEAFAWSAAAAFEAGHSLNLLLMELDVADGAAAVGGAARGRTRASWLRAIRATLDALDGRAGRRDAADADLADRVGRVVADATARGLQFDRRLADAVPPGDVPVDHLVLLTMRARCYRDEDVPGATG